MGKLAIIWEVLKALIYVAIAIGVLSAGESKFETLVLAILIELYTTLLFNLSVIDENAGVNNYAAFVRFRILAASQGVAGNEDGPFSEQEKAIVEVSNRNRPKVWTARISHAIVSTYALFKIIQAIL